MKRILAAVLVLGLATPTLAEDITTRDQLMTYLKERMPNDQMINHIYKVGDKLSAGQNMRGCLSERTLQQLSFIPRLLVLNGLMGLKVTKEVEGYSVIGGSASCEYEVSAFNRKALAKLGIEIVAEGNAPKRITVPLVKQNFLGVTKVDLKGHTSLGGTSCDIAFIPWFESVEPSQFAKAFAGDFTRDWSYKHVFSSEYETSRWCFQKHYDGSLKWVVWSRL